MNNTYLSGKSVLVTGGAGFIGSHLVRRLVAEDCSVTVIDAPDADYWRIKDLQDNVRIVGEDIAVLDAHRLSSVIKKAQVVYHLAARGVNPSDNKTLSIVRTNILGTQNMLLLSKKLGCKKFVYSGSCFEYGSGLLLNEKMFPKPISEYGASKSAAWLLVDAFGRQYNLATISIRPFTPYGPYEAKYRLIPYTILRALAGLEMDFTLGEQTRDFVFIDDLIQLFITAVTATKIDSNETFNACSGKAVSVREIVSLIVELTGSNVSPNFGAIPYRDTELWELSGSPVKAENILGWKVVTPLAEGLRKTIQWFIANKSEFVEYKDV